jgi:hypothetical protein
VVCIVSGDVAGSVNKFTCGAVVTPTRLLVENVCVLAVVGMMDRLYEISVLDAAEGDGVFSVVAATYEWIELEDVISINEPKEGRSVWRLLLYAVRPSCADVAELSPVRSPGVTVGVNHGIEAALVERDVVFGSGCVTVDVDFLFTKEESNSTLPFMFLAIATMAPTSAAVTKIAARQTATKHRMG